MQGNYPALSLEELATARAAIRVIRYLAVLAVGVLLPVVVVVATPLVAGSLLVALVLSPLVLFYLLVTSARHAQAARHQPGAG